MYTHVWSKYLPVIRILLKKAVSEEQKLSLNRTDFDKGTRTRKPSVSFNVEIINGRFSTISQTPHAKEFVATLLEDDLTKELLRQRHFKISLSSDLTLRMSLVGSDIAVVPGNSPVSQES